MPKRDSAPLGAPCWIDLFTSDPDRSRAFYGQLFGWTAEEGSPEFGGYWNFEKDGGHIAGGMVNDGEQGMPDVWSVYLAVADAKSTVDAAEANGSNVIVPAMDVADFGTMAIITDPGGAVVGLWQPGTHKGFHLIGEPGSPAWFQLLTRSYDASVDFYKTVFGWDTYTMADTPEFRYTTKGEGDAAQAGIMDATADLPEGAPAHWQVVFQVESVDATLALAVELGGSIASPAMDTPYGRLADAVDPTGARFGLVNNL
ncbi:MAG: VOC family protein [Acidimicrobiia bacterium]